MANEKKVKIKNSAVKQLKQRLEHLKEERKKIVERQTESANKRNEEIEIVEFQLDAMENAKTD